PVAERPWEFESPLSHRCDQQKCDAVGIPQSESAMLLLTEGSGAERRRTSPASMLEPHSSPLRRIVFAGHRAVEVRPWPQLYPGRAGRTDRACERSSIAAHRTPRTRGVRQTFPTGAGSNRCRTRVASWVR